jgi:transposase
MPALATPVHVAAVIDQTGRLCGTQAFPASTRGYVALVTWAEGFGPVERVGVEGTGTFGAGLTRFVRAYGLAVVEVARPDRSTRRRHGKSDPIDAQAAARATLAGVAVGLRPLSSCTGCCGAPLTNCVSHCSDSRPRRWSGHARRCGQGR